MDTNVNGQELKKVCNFFSIKNFIADMPRLLNEAFTIIYKALTQFYNPDTSTINCERGEIDYIIATTVVAQNFRIGDSSTDISTDFASLVQRIENLENNYNSIQYITRDMIDRDIDTRPYYDPDASTN